MAKNIDFAAKLAKRPPKLQQIEPPMNEGKPDARAGKALLSGWTSKEMRKWFRQRAAERETTIEALLNEAWQQYREREGK